MTRCSRPLESRENYCHKDKISLTFEKAESEKICSSMHQACTVTVAKTFFGLCEGAPELYPRYDLKITIPLTKKRFIFVLDLLFAAISFSALMALPWGLTCRDRILTFFNYGWMCEANSGLPLRCFARLWTSRKGAGNSWPHACIELRKWLQEPTAVHCSI